MCVGVRMCVCVCGHMYIHYAFVFLILHICLVSKLGFREFPHQMPSSQSTLLLRKWIFSIVHVSGKCFFYGDDHLNFTRKYISQKKITEYKDSFINKLWKMFMKIGLM